MACNPLQTSPTVLSVGIIPGRSVQRTVKCHLDHPEQAHQRGLQSDAEIVEKSLQFLERGSRWENRFNGLLIEKLRAELLKLELSDTLLVARFVIEPWTVHHLNRGIIPGVQAGSPHREFI